MKLQMLCFEKFLGTCRLIIIRGRFYCVQYFNIDVLCFIKLCFFALTLNICKIN